MIELVISLALVSLISTAVMYFFFGWTGLVNSLTMQAQRELDARRAALRIFTAARKGARILPEHVGLRFSDGTELRWRGERVLLRGHSLFPEPVRNFSVVCHQGRLHLTFELVGQRVYHGRNRIFRFEYDQEQP